MTYFINENSNLRTLLKDAQEKYRNYERNSYKVNEYYTKIENKSPEKIIKSLEKETENPRNNLNHVNGEEESGDVI